MQSSELNNQRITGYTSLYGIIADPIRHSLSPMVHNKAFQLENLDSRYIAFEVSPKDFQQGVLGMKALGIKGWNVSMPYKQEIMKYLDEISPEAALIGAVNTVDNKDGYLKGYNTDGKGFVKSLESRGIIPQNLKVVMAGAGGAASAILVALAMAGAAEVVIFAREGINKEKLSTLALELARQFDTEIHILPWGEDTKWVEALGDCRLFVNATPIGMQKEEMALKDIDLLSPEAFVSDVIYHPKETMLLKKASQAGHSVSNGTGMLLHQAAISFEIWTGRSMNIQEIEKYLQLTGVL